MAKKKPTHERECTICTKKFTHSVYAKFCSDRCYAIDRAEKTITGTEGYDYIRCPVCKQKIKEITQKHAVLHGFESPVVMAEFYKLDTTKCQAKRDAMKGENNPSYGHGGKYSKHSKNFMHGYDEQWHNQFKANMSEFRNENKELFKSNIEYWLKQCNGNEEEAKEQYRLFQTRDLNYFVGKYGEEEGNKRYKEKTEKWLDTMNGKSKEEIENINAKKVRKSTCFFSKAEKELYSELKKVFPKLKEQLAIFYQKDTGTKTSKIFDMALGNKIIEYNGDFWHANPKIYDHSHVCPYTKLTFEQIRERDNTKNMLAESNGYEVLIVWESDFKNNREQTIQRCITYLNS